MPLQSKITKCGSNLFRWGNHLSREFRNRILACKRRMGSLRGKWDDVSITQFTEAKSMYNELLHNHEVYWKQRLKLLWLKEVDMNSKYFHATTSTRKRWNTVGKLRNSQGQWCTRPEEVNELIAEYFIDIFSFDRDSYPEVLQCVTSKISLDQNHQLIEPFTAMDVQEAILSMHPDKSPGPDGMNPTFFQKFYCIVGDDVSSACLDFIRNCELPNGLNDTIVALIPKKSNPEYVTDLRPITLCNVIYKTIAKMLANRLKVVLESVISESQSAFISGRAITDNILISTEVIHYLKRKRQGKDGITTLKIDMSKAYDRVEWTFLKLIMLKMGFAADIVNLIMMCVTIVSYKIMRDGREIGPIIPSRGLRQGDPLSPYLFIIRAEGLSSLIHHYEKAGLLHGARVARGDPDTSHLFFADDCL